MKKKILIALSLSIAFLFTSCGTKVAEGDENTPITNEKTIAQNDYAGAYYRMTQLQQNVEKKMDILANHNYIIQSGNPEDYWSDDGYFFANFLPVYNENLLITSVLNEIDNFTDIQTYITEQLTQEEYSEISVVKKEPNNYRICYSGYFMDETTWLDTWGTMTLDCLYDPSANRFKVSESIEFSSSSYYTKENFYEFAELSKNKFVLQNINERLFIECNENGDIQYFAYSLLPEVEALDINDKMDVYEKDLAYNDWGFDGIVYSVPNTENLYVAFNENGIPHYFVEDLESAIFHVYTTENDEQNEDEELNYIKHNTKSITIPDYTKASSLGRYSETEDSIYNNLSSIGKEWVYAADKFEQTVKYENNTLTIMTTNPLTQEQNTFSVVENTSKPENEATEISETQDIVEE